ncbi:FAF1 [Acanthosepion pharaonis]|uniref:FAF1 n=1 Tax=Acanthosepion pharaonis TaxID=158019 RepID=A0A812CNX8_ACAPH|nr:FAF1 [Sepia pharaonis]
MKSERDQRQALIREQDQAYQLSLLADRRKELKRLEEEEVRRKERLKKSEEECIQRKEEEKRAKFLESLSKKVPPEPKAKSKWPTAFIRFRAPDGAVFARVDRIGRRTCSRHVVFLCCIISIHRFHDCTLLSGGNPFYASVAPFCYAIATWYMRASQSMLDPPVVQEALKLSAADGTLGGGSELSDLAGKGLREFRNKRRRFSPRASAPSRLAVSSSPRPPKGTLESTAGAVARLFAKLLSVTSGPRRLPVTHSTSLETRTKESLTNPEGVAKARECVGVGRRGFAAKEVKWRVYFLPPPSRAQSRRRLPHRPIVLLLLHLEATNSHA